MEWWAWFVSGEAAVSREECGRAWDIRSHQSTSRRRVPALTGQLSGSQRAALQGFYAGAGTRTLVPKAGEGGSAAPTPPVVSSLEACPG